MPVTKDKVIWAYRMILGREPESVAAVDDKTDVKNLATLRSEFVNSHEFRLNIPVISVGLHMEVDEDPIELECTPEQKKLMLDRIAAAWRQFGAEEPHWSVLTANQFKQSEIADSLAHFYATGEQTADELIALLKRNAIDPQSISRVMDYGCGVGRVSLALARRFEHVIGVDISPAHLKLARDRATELGVTTTEFIALEDIDSLPGLPDCDLLFSRIVLQHNPPPVIATLLDQLLDHVLPGGYAMFQVPTFISGFRFDPKSYLGSDQAQMEMNPLPQRHIFAMAARKGFVPIEVRENLDVGDSMMVSHIFLFQRN